MAILLIITVATFSYEKKDKSVIANSSINIIKMINPLSPLLIEHKTRGSEGQACVAHLTFRFEETLYRTFHRCFLPNFSSFGNTCTVSEDFFLEKINQSETRITCGVNVC